MATSPVMESASMPTVLAAWGKLPLAWPSLDAIALVFGAVVPVLAFFHYFVVRSRAAGSRSQFWASLGLGMLIAPPMLVFGPSLEAWALSLGDGIRSALAGAFVVAAIPEETGKFLIFVLFGARARRLRMPMDGLVHGAATGLGFAVVENLIYVLLKGSDVAWLRAFTSVPAHAFFGCIMGYYVAAAKFHPERWFSMAKALLVPIALHGFYNFPLRLDTAVQFADRGNANIAMPFLLIVLMAIWSQQLVRALSPQVWVTDPRYMTSLRYGMLGAPELVNVELGERLIADRRGPRTSNRTDSDKSAS